MVRPLLRKLFSQGLPAGAEEVVIRGVRYERLLAYVACHEAALRGRAPPVSVQTLNKRSLRHRITTGRTCQRPDCLQQEAADRTRVRATRIRTGGNGMDRLRPHLAGIERALPG